MQPSWATFSFGCAVGICTILFTSVASGIPAFSQDGFCEASETVLKCTRVWANAVAILTGAIVVVVTVAGQRAEAERHAETIRQAQTPEALRVSRAKMLTVQLRLIRIELEIAVAKAIEANKKYVSDQDYKVWNTYEKLREKILAVLSERYYKDIEPLLDFNGELAISNLRSHLRAWEIQLPLGQSDDLEDVSDIFIDAKAAAENRRAFREASSNIAEMVMHDIQETVDQLEALRRFYRV